MNLLNIRILLPIFIVLLAILTLLQPASALTASIGFYEGGTLVAQQEQLNQVVGNGLNLTAVDEPLDDRVTYTFVLDLLTTGADGDSTTTTSDSGLEFVGGDLTVLRGCTNNQILKWDEATDQWECAADVGAGGSVDAEEDNVLVVTGATAFDFQAGFDVVDDTGEADISLNTTELNSLTWGDNSLASILWTFDPTGATNPVVTISNSTVNVSTGDLQEGGSNVLTVADQGAGTDITADLEEEAHAGEHAVGAADEVAFYGTVQEEGSSLTQRRTVNFIGSSVTCVDNGGSSRTDCTISAGGSQDLQQTYDNETAPALITLSNTLGGIIFEGDSETSDAGLTLRDSTSGKLGLLIDNDDEAANESSPILRIANSTVGAGDTQFDLVVTISDSFQILGDDSSPDFTISSAGVVTIDNGLTVSTGSINFPAASISVADLATSGTWTFDGTFDGNATIAEAWDVNATGSINFAFASDLQIGGTQIDYADMAGSSVLVTSSNVLTFGANAASNPVLTFDTDEATDATITFDAVTDNRFETNKPLDVGGALTQSGAQVVLETRSIGTGDGLGGGGDLSSNRTFAVDLRTAGSDNDSTTIQSDSGLEFVTNQLTMLRGCSDNQILKWDETQDDWNCEADALGGGSQDLQQTYDNETAPALITLTDALGGIILEGDAETSDASLLIQDSTAGKLGLVLDNNDEAANEASPILRLVNSTSAGGDTQFDLVVTTSDAFEIRGDDGVADLTIASTGSVTLVNGLTVSTGTIDFPATSVAVADLATSGTWPFAGTLSGAADITGAWTVNASGSIDFASGADLLVGGAQIDYDDMVGSSAIVTSSNTLTLGANTASNPTLTFDTDEVTEATLLFDAVTDDRFEFNKPLDVAGTLSQSGTNVVLESRTLTGGAGIAALGDLSTDRTVSFASSELDTLTWNDGVEASFAWTFSVSGTNTVMTFGSNFINVSTGALQEGGSPVLTIADQGSGTDITGDLEEETHASEHALSAADEVAFYGRAQDEGSNLTQRRIINFLGAGISCIDDAVDSTDCTVAGGAGGEDLQQTYDLETSPSLITLTDALGGIIFEGDSETADATLTLRDSTSGKLGLLIDNDDETTSENSPILRLANSTVAGGDIQFDLIVTTSDELEIRGDDGAADLTISSTGAFTLANGLTVSAGAIDFPATSVAVADLATSGTWPFAGTLSGAADITGAWTVNAAGSMDFASGADLLVGSSQIDYGDLAQVDDLVTSSNVLTFGAGAASNPVLLFDTDEATDGTILFDAVTDNRFEINKPLDVAGALSQSGTSVVLESRSLTGGVGIATIGDLSADRTVTFASTELGTLVWSDDSLASFTWTYAITGAATDPVITFSDGVINVSTGALQEGGSPVLTVADQDAGTDITGDLEEETHATEHAISGADEVAFYGRAQDEGSNLTQRRIINFLGAGVSCADDAVDSTDCTIGGGASQDFQDTYDNETAPILVTLTDALGGITFEGDAETTNPTLTLRDATADKVGLILDNDDEAANENSPVLRLANSTSVAGDIQFDLVVTTSSEFEIRGDDGAADLTISSAGAFTLSNGLTVSGGTIDFPATSVAVADLATSGTWPFAGTLSGNADITGAWTVNASGSIDFASGADLLIASSQIDYGNLAQADNLVTSSNVVTFGAGTSSNPTLTFDTDEATDATILFDAVTANRFAINKPLAVAGNISQSGTLVVLESRTLTGGTGIAAIGDLSSDRTVSFAATELDTLTWNDGVEASFAWTFSVSGTNTVMTFGSGTINVSTGALQEGGSPVLTVADQGSGTDITGDLEEESHASEHSISGADEVVFYGRVQDESSNLTQRRIINFLGSGVSCVDDAVDSTDCTIAGGAGGEDLQQTYDQETAPALITLSDALGGIIFEGDAETSDAGLLIRDSTAGKLGLVLDNDDEAANENSPILRIINSTSAGGDTQFDLLVNTSDAFVIAGDDGAADLTIDSTGAFTLANGLTVSAGTIDFPPTSIAVADLATTGTWAFSGTLSAAADITGAWTVNAAGSISFASGADLLVGGAQIDFDDLASLAAITTSSNALTFGANAASNPVLTFDTDEGTDATILFDAVTDNRFEINKSLDVGGALTESGVNVLNATDEGLADADLFVTCDSTSDDLVDSTCVEQDSGTDISANLEEEAHNTEHALSGDDILYEEREAFWYISGDVTTGVKPIRVYANRSWTLKDVRCSVNTAGTTSSIIVDVNKNGTTIFTTQSNRPTITAAGFTDVSGTPDVTTAASGDEFRIEVDQADSGDTGADLTCQLRFRHPVDSSS